MVGVSVSVNLPLAPIKSRSSLLAPAHPGGPAKKGRKTVVVVVVSNPDDTQTFIAPILCVEEGG